MKRILAILFVVIAFVAGAPSLLAARAECLGEADIYYPDGSVVHCNNFCFVYRDDGSYAGYICS